MNGLFDWFAAGFHGGARRTTLFAARMEAIPERSRSPRIIGSNSGETDLKSSS